MDIVFCEGCDSNAGEMMMSDEREPLWIPTPDEIAALRRTLEQQDKRIERFVELVDQLERKLQEATEANTSCTIYIASQMERIGDLEAQLAQTWQPLPINQVVQYNGEWPAMPAEYANDQLALCRLVERAEVQPYSHRNGETEPPTVEGWYAMQHPQAWNWQGSTFVFVERNMDGIDVYCAGQDDPIWYDQMDSRIRWYGPIVAPWEDCHE